MKKIPTSNLTASLSLLFILAFNAAYSSGVDAPYNCLPPMVVLLGPIQGDPVYLSQFHATYSDGTAVYDLTQLQHFEFDTLSCDTPPANVGDSTIHSKYSFVSATLTIQGGTSVQIDAPATMTVKVKKIAGSTPQTGTYETEMLSLDISGGTLPPGVVIHESPTITSLGQTTISLNGNGTYHIDSYFDIYTEFSSDNGLTFSPASTGAVHMALYYPPSMTIGINNIDQQNYIEVFPNPAVSFITIYSSNLISKETFKVFNVNGDCVIRGNFKGGYNKIDLAGLPAGKYFLLTDSGRNRKVKQFIISK